MSSVDGNVEQRKSLDTAGDSLNWYNHFGNSFPHLMTQQSIPNYMPQKPLCTCVPGAMLQEHSYQYCL